VRNFVGRVRHLSKVVALSANAGAISGFFIGNTFTFDIGIEMNGIARSLDLRDRSNSI
jgi:hypothetical protein